MYDGFHATIVISTQRVEQGGPSVSWLEELHDLYTKIKNDAQFMQRWSRRERGRKKGPIIILCQISCISASSTKVGRYLKHKTSLTSQCMLLTVDDAYDCVVI